MRTALTIAVGASLLGLGLPLAAPAQALPIVQGLQADNGNIVDVQFRRRLGGFHGGGGRFHGGAGFRGRFGGGGRYGYRHRGIGVGAGLAGLAAGAIIGGAIANSGPGYYAPEPVYGGPVGGDPEAYCASRFQSYDPSSGTYLGYDGNRHPCP